MEPIADRDGDPLVFDLVRLGAGLWLNADYAKPSDRWGAGNEFVFRTRKSFDPFTLESASTPSLDEAIKVCKANGLKVVRIKTVEEEL